jgi:hypothetical protein
MKTYQNPTGSNTELNIPVLKSPATTQADPSARLLSPTTGLETDYTAGSINCVIRCHSHHHIDCSQLYGEFAGGVYFPIPTCNGTIA